MPKMVVVTDVYTTSCVDATGLRGEVEQMREAVVRSTPIKHDDVTQVIHVSCLFHIYFRGLCYVLPYRAEQRP